MNPVLWILVGIAALLIVLLCALYFVSDYFFRFTMLRKNTTTLDNCEINANTEWTQYKDFVNERHTWLEKQEKEDVYIRSFDGLKLHATLLRCENSKKCVICFHGYTSKGLNEFGSMAKFYYEQNFNIIMIDARNHGDSEGKYTGFGVLDRQDAARWIDYAVGLFGDDVKIIIHGISMGGATVLMTSGLKLPENVKAIIADCAFTSAYDIFSYILKRDYHLPRFPLLNVTEIINKHRAGYGFKDVNTLCEVGKTKIPILFIHGSVDDYVPVRMSEENYKACKSEKELLIIDGADHAESYYAATEIYENAVKRTIEKYT